MHCNCPRKWVKVKTLNLNFKVKLFVSINAKLTFVAGALSAITTAPQNVVIQKGDDVYMECSTDYLITGTINSVQWIHDSKSISQIPCTIIDTTRYILHPSPPYGCSLTALGNSSSGNQGPYKCTDSLAASAEAIAILMGLQLSCCNSRC